MAYLFKYFRKIIRPIIIIGIFLLILARGIPLFLQEKQPFEPIVGAVMLIVLNKDYTAINDHTYLLRANETASKRLLSDLMVQKHLTNYDRAGAGLFFDKSGVGRILAIVRMYTVYFEIWDFQKTI